MQVFDSDGVRIAYIDVPASKEPGDPVVLVHGFASTHAVNWVNTLWTKTLAGGGYRVIALDNRGHGQSDKLYDPAQYHSAVMAEDVRRLLDHLGIGRADVFGYSMGARNTAYLALNHPGRVRSAIIGGLGVKLVDGVGLPLSIADGMEAPSVEAVSDPTARGFRAFAERNQQDLRALAACIRGSRQVMSREEVARITAPTLVTRGTDDEIAGSPRELAVLMRNASAVDIPGRDHNSAVGDKAHKQAVLAFLAGRP
jgi:pimeloyl-ACP methyl ester carboxylesterase